MKYFRVKNSFDLNSGNKSLDRRYNHHLKIWVITTVPLYVTMMRQNLELCLFGDHYDYLTVTNGYDVLNLKKLTNDL